MLWGTNLILILCSRSLLNSKYLHKTSIVSTFALQSVSSTDDPIKITKLSLSWLAGWQRVGRPPFLNPSTNRHLLYWLHSTLTPPILFCLAIKIASWKFSVFTLSVSCLSMLTCHFHDEIDVLTTIVMMDAMKFENWFVLCRQDAQFLSCSSFWISAFWNVKIWNGRKTLMILESN